MRIINTPDGESVLFSLEVNFVVDIIREQQRIKVSMKENENDSEYSKTILATPIENCKMSEGKRTTIFSKIIFENFFKSPNVNYTCPFKANTTLKVENCLITDNLLPPTFGEKKVKIESSTYGIVRVNNKTLKGWKLMNAFVLLASVKK
jgi:LysM repeat protein